MCTTFIWNIPAGMTNINLYHGLTMTRVWGQTRWHLIKLFVKCVLVVIDNINSCYKNLYNYMLHNVHTSSTVIIKTTNFIHRKWTHSLSSNTKHSLLFASTNYCHPSWAYKFLNVRDFGSVMILITYKHMLILCSVDRASGYISCK
jgi:hypothetical protein